MLFKRIIDAAVFVLLLLASYFLIPGLFGPGPPLLGWIWVGLLTALLVSYVAWRLSEGRWRR